ncbi:hypothetical protein KQX54_011185 [Cotesia glomerata]|uniref:Uncharacterized protein n=1 Tax=Cotesia glomerata TaxID=32391 RepID=A0AAV7J8H0_COTGL|nr:hypothetical protein KQX54_011185 [Cotesia glomerata]
MGIVKGWWIQEREKSSIVMTCPAQEPVGTKAPTFTGEMKGWMVEKLKDSTIVMSCPAQAYPVPAFRKAPAFTGDIKASGWLVNKRLNSTLAMPCPAQEPVGSKAPAFIGELRGGWKAKSANTSVVMSCPAQEPVGSKAPSIQGEEGTSMKRRGGTDIVIPCYGQGYPVPNFRACWKQSSFNPRRRTELYEATWWHQHRDTMSWSRLPCPCFQIRSRYWVALKRVFYVMPKHFPNQRSEPVGTKAPSILGEKGSLMERKVDSNIVILCQAQAYPVPTFR